MGWAIGADVSVEDREVVEVIAEVDVLPHADVAALSKRNDPKMGMSVFNGENMSFSPFPMLLARP